MSTMEIVAILTDVVNVTDGKSMTSYCFKPLPIKVDAIIGMSIRVEMFYESEPESETVSSSVYHGECESLQTRGEDEGDGGESSPTAPVRSKASAGRSSKPSSKKSEPPVRLVEDVLVGHELGARPLLADDELDNEDVHQTFASTSTANDCCTTVSKSAGGGTIGSVVLSFLQRSEDHRKEPKVEDVFSLAPFTLPPKVVGLFGVLS